MVDDINRIDEEDGEDGTAEKAKSGVVALVAGAPAWRTRRGRGAADLLPSIHISCCWQRALRS